MRLLLLKLNVCRDCIFRIHVDRLHEPSRLVRPDWKYRRVKRTKSCCYFPEIRVKTGITCEEHSVMTKSQSPAAPQCCIPVPREATGKVLCGRAHCRHESEAAPLPPVQFLYIGRTAFSEELSNAKWCQPFGLGESLNQPANGVIVQVIIVVVGDEHRVERSQSLEVHCRRMDPTWPGELNGRCTTTKNGIGEDRESARLNQKRTVADPGHGEPGAARTGHCSN